MSDDNKLDVAPPYNAVARHGVSPVASHDEIARFNFLANFNKFLGRARARQQAGL